MKKLLITHIDLDSILPHVFAEIYADKLQFNKVIHRDYNFEDEEENLKIMQEYDEIVFADLSMKKEVYDLLTNQGKKIKFYDHHSSASWIKDLPDSVYNNEICGTKIFFEEYVKPRIGRYDGIIDYLVDLVDTYDCWREDSLLWEEAKSLNSVLYGMFDWSNVNPDNKMNKFITHLIYRIEHNTSTTWHWMSQEIEIINKANEKELTLYHDALRTMQTRIDEKGLTYAMIVCPAKISLVCSKILKEREKLIESGKLDNKKKLDYIVCFSTFGGYANGKLSFRTRRRDLDLNQIAAAKGHESAAGGVISERLAINFWNNPRKTWAYKDNINYLEDNEETWVKTNS